MSKDLNEDEAKSTLKNKRIELAPTRYMYREEKIKENMNIIYGIEFGQCTPSIKSVLKGVTKYENKSKYFDCFWIMEELKKITVGVYVKAKPGLPLIEQLILFVNMRQGPTETNDEYLESLNPRLQNLILPGREKNM